MEVPRKRHKPEEIVRLSARGEHADILARFPISLSDDK
jgi:hypothetical protein